MVRAPEAWCVNTGAQDFRVAVIDSGIGGYTHPDFFKDANGNQQLDPGEQYNIWTNPLECPGGGGTCVPNGIDDDQNGYIDDFYGWNFHLNYWDVTDTIPGSHGTHVAGIIGAVGNNGVGVVGMNWQVKLVILKYADGLGFVSEVLSALNYCVVNNIKVSNNSYIGSGLSVTECAAIQSAGDQIGHIFVAAAGNSGYDLDVNPQYPVSCAKSQVGCSVCPITNIITVTATNQYDNRACLRWLTHCPPNCPATCANYASYGDQTVHLGAPGVSIYSTIFDTDTVPPSPAYNYASGTSEATPHVTGAVALVWAQHPTWTYQQVRNLILNSVHKGPLAGQTITGGRLDVAAALLDCNNNGVADGIDVNTFTSFDCNDNNVPDECESLGACCSLPPGDCVPCITYGECKALHGAWAEGETCFVCAMFRPPGP